MSSAGDDTGSRGTGRSADDLARAEPTAPIESRTPTPSVRTFQPDEWVAGRYRIIRFIARGGMGEVYEAEDEELHSRVALKTIRADLADDEAVLERFRTEISLARRVTHA